VTETTINNWKHDYPGFFERLSQARDRKIFQVVDSLYNRATGYEHAEEKIFCSDGSIIRAKTIKRYPPDVNAAKFLLTNRKSNEWQEKRTITGDDTEATPIKVEIVAVDKSKKGE
jgi:hypothetical protein